MHLQIRLIPKTSPPDVDKVLERLAGKVNLVGVGGSDLEFGGELALVPQDGQEQDALDALASYHPRVLHVDDPDSGLKLCVVDSNESGSLHRCLKGIAEENLEKGRIIRDILIGVPDRDQQAAGQTPVHVYSELIRTPQSLGSNSAA